MTSRFASSARSARARRPASGERGATLSDLLVGTTTAALVAALGVGIYGRMATSAGDARRSAELEGRLEAARAMIARDLRQDGYRLDELGPAALPGGALAPAPGEVAFAYVDDSAETRVAAAAPDALPGGVLPVERGAGLAAGDWIAIGGSTGNGPRRVVAVTDEGAGRAWLVLEGPAPVRGAPGDPVLRVVVRRYRATGSDLQVAEGPDGAWRAVVEGIDRLEVSRQPGAPGEACALHRLVVGGVALAPDGEAERAVRDGLVCARNRRGGAR